MSRLKIYPVGDGNHDNIHYIVKHKYFTLKLSAFPKTNKIYIMSASIKTDKRFLDREFLFLDIQAELLDRWNLELIANPHYLFELRFENTTDLLQSNYYKNSL